MQTSRNTGSLPLESKRSRDERSQKRHLVEVSSLVESLGSRSGPEQRKKIYVRMMMRLTEHFGNHHFRPIRACLDRYMSQNPDLGQQVSAPNT